MRVPHRVRGLSPSQQGLSYLSGNTSPGAFGAGVASALGGLGVAVGELGDYVAQRNEKTQRFATMRGLDDFQTQAATRIEEMKRNADPAALNFTDLAEQEYSKLETEFLQRVPGHLQDEFRYRTNQIKQQVVTNSLQFQYQQQDAFFKAELDAAYNSAKNSVADNPASFDQWDAKLVEEIDATDLPESVKASLKRDMRAGLAAVSYGKAVEQNAYATRTHQGGWIGALKQKESSGNPGAFNQLGYAGFYQFGAPRLAHMGVYSPGPDEPMGRWSKLGAQAHGKWSGEFNIPGFPGVRTIDDFLASPAAQEKAFEIHVAQMDKEIVSEGLDKYIGTEVGGRPLTREGLYSMIHLGGARGTRNFLAGGANAADANGTRLSDYAKMAYEAGDVFDEDPRYAEIPYETRLAMRQDGEAKAVAQITADQKAQDAAYNSATNSLLVGIADGNLGQSAIDAWREANPGFKYSDLARAQDVLKDVNENLNLRATGFSMIQNNEVFDPTNDKHKKILNAVTGKETLAAIQNRDPNAVTQGIIPLMRQVNDIPTDVAGMFQGMMRSNDPQTALFALDSMAQMQAEDPRAFAARFPDKVVSDVELWRARKGYYAQDELLNLINGGRSPEERQARNILKEEAKSVLKDVYAEPKDLVNEVLGHFDSWMPGDAPSVGNVAWAARAVEADFQEIFTEEYVRYQNPEEARNATLERMSRLWGPTDIGGSRVLMKYPPELAGYKDPEAFDRHVQEELVELGVAERPEPGEISPTLGGLFPDRVNYQLISDEQTRAEVEAFKAGVGEPPSYMIFAKDPSGTLKMVMDPDSPTLPLRMNYKPSESEAAEQEQRFNQNHNMILFRGFREEYRRAEEHQRRTGTPIPEDMEEEMAKWREKLGLPEPLPEVVVEPQ